MSCGYEVQVTLFGWGYAKYKFFYVHSQLLSIVITEWVNNSDSQHKLTALLENSRKHHGIAVNSHKASPLGPILDCLSSPISLLNDSKVAATTKLVVITSNRVPAS